MSGVLQRFANIIRSHRIAFALLFFILVMMQPILYHSVAIGVDEGYFAFMGNSILHGSIPYIDYADNKPPGIWYLMSLGFLVFGKSIYVAREITYVANALSAFILFLIGRKLWNEKVGMISALLFLVGILIPDFEGYYALTEPFLTLFSLLGFLFFIKGRRQTSYLLAGGAAIGIATLFKQTGLLLLIAIIIFYLGNFWIPVNRNKDYLAASARSILLLLCGFFIPVLAVVAYFWSVHALGPLADYMILGLKGYGTQFDLSTLKEEFLSFSIIWALSAVSLLTIGYKFIKKSSDWETLVSIWLLLTLSPLISRQYGHYFIQVLPPACLLASLQMVNIMRRPSVQNKNTSRQHGTAHFFVIACIVILALITVVFSSYSYIASNTNLTLQSQIQTADYIRAHTVESDRILVYPYQPSIYFLSDRDPCVKVLILERPVVDENMELELLRQISEGNPKYVVMETDAEGEIKPGIPSIYEFIVRHFQKDNSIGRFQIFRNIGG